MTQMIPNVQSAILKLLHPVLEAYLDLVFSTFSCRRTGLLRKADDWT